MADIVTAIVDCARNGGVVYCFGNGGSAAQAGHMAAELVVRYEKDRAAVAAVDLSAQGASMTAAINDFGPTAWPSRALEAANARDVVFLLTTSCRSPNVVRAVESVMNRSHVDRLGHDVPFLCGIVGNYPNRLPGKRLLSRMPHRHAFVTMPFELGTRRIQEQTLVWLHTICAEVEKQL